MPTHSPPSALTTKEIWFAYGDALIAGGLNILAAAAILVFGIWTSGLAAGALRKWAGRARRADETVVVFLSSIVRYVILAFVLIAVLQRFGIQTTSIVAVLGAAALAVGLALQGTLSNVASGVMLILLRPYGLNQLVEIAGKRGTVRDITLFTTELNSVDNLKIVIPNSQAWGQVITNYSAHGTRRQELRFNIAYEDDLKTAMAAIQDAVAREPLVLADPAPAVVVTELAEHYVVLAALVWTKVPDTEPVRRALLQACLESLGTARLRTPYPVQRNVAGASPPAA